MAPTLKIWASIGAAQLGPCMKCRYSLFETVSIEKRPFSIQLVHLPLTYAIKNLPDGAVRCIPRFLASHGCLSANDGS